MNKVRAHSKLAIRILTKIDSNICFGKTSESFGLDMTKVRGQLPSVSKSQPLFYVSCVVQQYGRTCALSDVVSVESP
jgi:hypothetical protein